MPRLPCSEPRMRGLLVLGRGRGKMTDEGVGSARVPLDIQRDACGSAELDVQRDKVCPIRQMNGFRVAQDWAVDGYLPMTTSLFYREPGAGMI